MQKHPQSETHYGVGVWVNPITEALRKTECLCLNCKNLKPGPDNCAIAQALYQICVQENVALVVTRCPVWKSKAESPVV